MSVGRRLAVGTVAAVATRETSGAELELGGRIIGRSAVLGRRIGDVIDITVERELHEWQIAFVG
jgi:hypothetical protein